MRTMIAFLFASLVLSVTAFSQTSRPADAAASGKELTRKVPTLKMTGVPLEQAIDFLRDASALNINVNWHALELLNVTKQTPISLKLTDVPLRRIIRAVLDETGAGQALTYYVEDGIVEITTKEIADQEMITRVYPVDDLILFVPDFVAPKVSIQNQNSQTSGSGGGGGGGGSGSLFDSASNSSLQDTAASKQKRADDLVKMLKDTVKPEIWRDNGGPASMSYFNGHLVVTAPRSVHEMLSRRM